MRNLKRALSLVLAAAMLIGMMVVGASAVSYNDFSDRGEIVNKDAVSMLTTLEIIEGKPDGSYAPGENVDRAQMAKMISVMLSNNQNCDDLYMNVNSGLTDISANWAKGYINYCYTLGVIAGRGNGTFDPSANVTAVEAAKMLLTALGYEAEIEGLVGDDWALNTAALAHELGIFRNFDKDVSAPLNRDDAALLIYNAMDVEMIEQYQNGYALSYADHRTILSYVFGVIRVEGVVVANEWAQLQQTDSDAALREGRTTLANVVWYDSTTSNTRVEEGVKETEPVTFNVTTPVEYMGKAVTMYVEKTTILANSKVLGVATNDEANVLNFTAEGQDTVKDYLKGTGVSVNEDTQYYVNYGYFKNEDAAIDWINEYHHTEDQGNDFSLNGIEVQVIDNDKDGVAEYVLYLQETLSEVSRYNERNETVSFYTPNRESNNQLNGKTSTATVDLSDVVKAEKVSLEGVTTSDNLTLASEDLILYVQYGGRTYISLPEIVTGKMTRLDRDKDDELYITVNDSTYYQSYILDAASLVDVDVNRFIIADAREDVGFDTTYDFILDSNGYVVAVRPAEEVVTNYALVLDSAWTQNALTRGGEVKILKADGTEATYQINWKESAKAFEHIDTIRDDVTGKSNDVKLEYYLGSRDVHDDTGNTNYKTGRAAGSIIVYSLNDAGTELTIESVLQGNVFSDNSGLTDTVEIETDANQVDVTDTAGVADNGSVIFMDGNPNSDNLQYVDKYGYDNGYGRITVEASNQYPGRTVEKTYAVDQNTVAFYYYYDTTAKEYVYGVATGWDKMSDISAGTDVQVYPVLEKTSNRTYKASNLAGVILFEAKPATTAADYMLVLSANAIGKDLLELNVVFEDGTVKTIKVDDKGDYFDENDSSDYMKAWTYSENSDGTYDIGTMANKWGTADLLITGTIDLNNGDYLALPSTAKVWDVTDVKSAKDTVSTGRFQENVYVNTVAIISEGQVRTAWVWDLDDDADIGGNFNWNWNLTNYENIYPFSGGWGQWQILQALADGKNVRVLGDLSLESDLYIPEGLIVQVEGSLTDNGYNITGGGTLRVRNDFVASSGAINVTTQVGDAVGDDLLLGKHTTISARVGVYGDIIGNTVNDIEGSSANRLNNLTVSSGSNVYVNGDVECGYLTVNGHIEANDYHISDGEVNSTRTLVALGNVTVYGGTLTLGNTAAGNATVNGKISGTGDLNVNNGTLTLTRSASIDGINDVTVGAKGVITQTNGVTHNLNASGIVTINGTVTIPGTVNATSVVLNSTGKLTVTSTPANLTNNGGELIVVGGGDGGTTTGLELKTLKIKGVDVNFRGNSANVTLGAEAVNGEKNFDVTSSLTGTDVVVSKGGSAVAINNDPVTSGTYIITLSKDGYTPVSYTVAVTCKDLVKVTVTDDGANVSIKNNDKVVKGEAITFTVSDTATKTVTKVVYSIDGGKQNEELGETSGTYTIPADKVTGDVTITVTTGNKAIDASVELEVKNNPAVSAYLTGSDKNWTLTVPDKSYFGDGSWLANVIQVTEDSQTTSAIDMNTAKKTSTGTEEDVWTLTFQGTDGAGEGNTATPFIITLTVKSATDANKLAWDMEQAVENINKAIANGTIKYQDTDLSQGAIEAALAEKVKTAIGTLDWKSTLKDDSVKVTLTDDWSNPGIGENGNKNCNFTIDFTLKSNDVEKAADTMRVVINVENKTI